MLIYETDLGKLYRRDATEWLRELPDGSVNLIIADPPYGANAVHWDRFGSIDAYVTWCEGWISECSRLLTSDGSLFICGWSENLCYLKVFGDKHFPSCRWLVWHYRNKHAPWRTDWGRAHESLLHFRKSKRFKFNQDAVRVPYNAHTLKYPRHTQATTSVFGASQGGANGHVWQPHPLGAKPKDVFEISVLNNGMVESTPHPTQKPEELVRQLVMACSDKGDLVLDPFGGSGTAYVVAEKLERRWLGSEAEDEYLRYTTARLRGIVPNETAYLAQYVAAAQASVENRESVRSGRIQSDPRQSLLGEDDIPEVA